MLPFFQKIKFISIITLSFMALTIVTTPSFATNHIRSSPLNNGITFTDRFTNDDLMAKTCNQIGLPWSGGRHSISLFCAAPYLVDKIEALAPGAKILIKFRGRSFHIYTVSSVSKPGDTPTKIIIKELPPITHNADIVLIQL